MTVGASRMMVMADAEMAKSAPTTAAGGPAERPTAAPPPSPRTAPAPAFVVAEVVGQAEGG